MGPYWLAAVYDSTSSGIKLTRDAEDACTWVTQEAAVKALTQISGVYTEDAFLQAVEEPNYPPSWGVKTQDAMPVEVL